MKMNKNIFETNANYFSNFIADFLDWFFYYILSSVRYKYSQGLSGGLPQALIFQFFALSERVWPKKVVGINLL